jgi:ribosomal protein L17
MRHKKSGRKLNRNASHRRALSRNLVSSFFESFGTEREYILTTVAKAKEYRSVAEKYITMGKKAEAARRSAAAIAGLSVEDLVPAWKVVRKEERQQRQKAKAERKGLEFAMRDIDDGAADSGAMSTLRGLDQEARDKIEVSMMRAQHYRRMAASRLQNEARNPRPEELRSDDDPKDERRRDIVKLLFDEIAPAFMERQGGYTRVLKTSVRRVGDGTFKAMLAFSEHGSSD